ncbi:MAG: cytochrome c3 family protein [Verrucomicrobiae bacterium]
MNKRPSFPLAPVLSRCFSSRRAKLLWLSGGGLALTLALISCGTLSQPIMAPPSIPGATFVGSKACAECHEVLVRDFKTAGHARLQAQGKNAEGAGCESCHGPGSKHIAAGGGAGSIINPRKDPETCFRCHLEIRAKFSLPYRHWVLEGRMGCGDCHNPHKGSVMKGGGATNLMSKNEVCFQCHQAQRGPYVFEHEAMREGCVVCHDPHGSVNQKLLVSRNAILCLKCHFQNQNVSGQPGQPALVPGSINIADGNHRSRLSQGTCWSGGCHEAMHGSQVNSHLRY